MKIKLVIIAFIAALFFSPCYAEDSISPFTLTTCDNQSFTNKNLEGQWTLIYFGFAHCGSTCPKAMTALNKIYNNLKDAKKTLPQVVFISIDPDRDTADHIKKFVTRFNPEFQGVSGDKAQLDKLTTELKVGHSGKLFLINPEGKVYATYTAPYDIKAIAHEISS